MVSLTGKCRERSRQSIHFVSSGDLSDSSTFPTHPLLAVDGEVRSILLPGEDGFVYLGDDQEPLFLCDVRLMPHSQLVEDALSQNHLRVTHRRQGSRNIRITAACNRSKYDCP